jgi:hypothetical protein
MNKILLLFTASLFILSSCNKEEFYGKRLNGTWTYERACYQEKTFKRTDILEDYKDLKLEFSSNNTISILNESNNSYSTGLYEIDEDFTSTTDFDGNPVGGSSLDLVLSYEDTTSKKKYLEIWDQASIGKKKIRFQRMINGKRAYFVLIKQ